MVRALILIDLQKEMERRITEGVDYVGNDIATHTTALISAWREKGWPILHVQHHSHDKNSPFHPDQTTAELVDWAIPASGEPVFIKHTSSPFESTAIDEWLQQHHINGVTLAGAVLGFCISSTTRSAHDKGYQVQLVKDAVLTFGLVNHSLTARQIFDVETVLLSDFAEWVNTKELIQ